MTSQAGGQDPSLDRAGPPYRGLGPRAVVWGAFTVSAAVHVFFIALYPRFFGSLEPSAGDFFPQFQSAVPSDAMEVLRVIEVDVPPDVAEPDQPVFEPIERRTASVGAPVPSAPVVDFARPGVSAAERLRPNVRDRRLWAPIPEEYTRLTLEQREELLLAGRLAEWYDSLQAAQAAELAWTDWTFTDSDGKKWGISEGQLHLGGVTIPLPTFGPAPGAARERAWELGELARQQSSMAVQQTVKERMEAIRARRDRERAAQQADTTGPRQ
jgi:hypothetical protein